MSKEDYDLDTKYSGIDQIDRLYIWSKAGAKLIDFDYIQPSLSEYQSPNNTLILSVISNKEKLSPSLLKYHLTRFFHISVKKGIHNNDINIKNQMTDLDEMISNNVDIPLIDITKCKKSRHVLKSMIEEKTDQSILKLIR
jgi:hypothetical protein